jgi:hypothetical protein
MSTRRSNKNDPAKEVEKMRKELDDLKAQARASDASSSVGEKVNSHEFDQLTPTEQSAASLGINPNSWSPISFL